MTHLFRFLPRWETPGLQALVPALPFLAAAPVEFELSPLHIVLTVVLLVICLGIHEAAHAWTAALCGDTTAKDMGRITLNPLAHIDPIMTVVLPAFLLIVSQGQFVFGGAKPVPVNFHRLRHPWRDMSIVALAGPFSNLLLAFLFMAAAHFFIKTGLYNGASEYPYARTLDLLPSVLMQAVGFNLLLTVFNLVPIPPLDGSRVMAWLLPPGLRGPYVAIERFGLLIVILITTSSVFMRFLHNATYDLSRHVQNIVTLGGLW